MVKKFFITEVFSENPYGGNQLATFPDSEATSADEMQKIARAINFSETTFVTGGSMVEGYDVRIFTPTAEIPFAGHPALGTAYLLRNLVDPHATSMITVNLGVGPICVIFDAGELVWIQQNEPKFQKVIEPEVVAEELGLDYSQLDTRPPCQVVSTGLEFLIVPLRNYEALKQAVAPIYNKLPAACFLFCPGGYDAGQEVRARMFAIELGVIEDPATGSANGCLAAYLAAYQVFGETLVEVKVGQGYEIDRPSQLYIYAKKEPDSFNVKVGGKVRLVAEGEWLF